jgi:hypothetical protein
VSYPCVVGRGELNGVHTVNVRMSDDPLDVFHMDLKPGEQLTDEEAIIACEFLREIQRMRSDPSTSS